MQHIRKVNNTEKDLIETIKYGAKIFTDPEVKKGKGNRDPIIYAAALHEIYKSMDGKKLFTSFGFNLPKLEKSKSKNRIALNPETWLFECSIADYVNLETGQVMTKYEPSAKLLELLEKINKTAI